MNDISYKDQMLNWVPGDKVVSPDIIGRWHKGKVYNQLPTKQQLKQEGMSLIATGWLPNQPIIDSSTRVLAVGSCFARNFTLWLAEHGFNQAFPDSPYNALLRFNADFESPAVIAQQFRWAFDELDPKSLLWIDKNRHLIEATDEGKTAVRTTLEQTDVLILTLGLSEIWYDKISGEPLWRALTEEAYDPERHIFRVETVAQTLEWLEAIERIRKKYLPKLKIIFTISPIPLKTTFRPISAITANSVSKAILRAALDKFLRQHEAVLNNELYYFPSYEFVTSFFVDPFCEDNRHLVPLVPGRIISFFVEHYCDSTLATERDPDSFLSLPGEELHNRVMSHSAIVSENDRMHELLVRVSELEEDIGKFRQVCEERQLVINELSQAAAERLALIEKLSKIAEERLQIIHGKGSHQ